MNNNIIHNKRIVLRFLKETNLLPYWKEYLDSSMHKNRDKYDSKIHWADKKHIVDVIILDKEKKTVKLVLENR